MNYKILSVALIGFFIGNLHCGVGDSIFAEAVNKGNKDLADYIYFQYKLDYLTVTGDKNVDNANKLNVIKYNNAFKNVSGDLSKATQPKFGGGGSFSWNEKYNDKATEAADKFKNLFTSGNQDDKGLKAADAVVNAAGKTVGSKEVKAAHEAFENALKTIGDAKNQLPAKS